MTTRRALAFSFLDRYAALILSIGSSMVIARLLTPAEIGVFSVTMVLLAFITALRDFGAGQYLVQERELTPDRIRAAWTVLLGTGCAFAVVIAALAVPVAAFYRDPRIVDIMLVIALNFAINPFGALTYAWLVREMRFDKLALMRFCGSVAGAAVSLGLAWSGAGAISLALGSLASTLINALLAAWFRPSSFPFWPGVRDLRRVFSFGGRISATSLLNAGNGGAHELMLGRLQGLEATALFSRANGLVAMFQRMFLDATQSVATPMFARASREANGDIRQPLLMAIACVTALGWAFFIGLALLAHPVVRVLYGDQWDTSVQLTRILCVGYALALPAAMCPAALTSVGKVDWTMKLTGAALLVHVTVLLVGTTLGLTAAAMAFSLSYGLGCAIWLRAMQRATGVTWRELAEVCRKSIGVASVTALAPWMAVVLFGWEPTLRVASLAFASVFGIALFVAAAKWFDHPIYGELVRLLPARFKRRTGEVS